MPNSLLNEHIENTTSIPLHKDPSRKPLQENSARLAIAPNDCRTKNKSYFYSPCQKPHADQHRLKNLTIKYSYNYIVYIMNIYLIYANT